MNLMGLFVLAVVLVVLGALIYAFKRARRAPRVIIEPEAADDAAPPAPAEAPKTRKEDELIEDARRITEDAEEMRAEMRAFETEKSRGYPRGKAHAEREFARLRARSEVLQARQAALDEAAAKLRERRAPPPAAVASADSLGLVRHIARNSGRPYYRKPDPRAASRLPRARRRRAVRLSRRGLVASPARTRGRCGRPWRGRSLFPHQRADRSRANERL